MRILVLSNLTSYTFGFRFEILEALRKEGHEIVIACHNDDATKQQALESLGCTMVEVPFNGKGKNVKEELSLVRTYRGLVRQTRPDIVFTFTIKMNLYGGMAAKSAKVPYVPMITGLGELEKTGKLQKLLLLLHKYVMPGAKVIFFQNQANIDFFRAKNIRCREAILLPGSGINLQRYAYAEYPSEQNGINFAFIGRVTPAKGITEYIKAAELQKAKGLNARFYVAGLCDDALVPMVEKAVSNGSIEYLGKLSDSGALLRKSHCLVLPTYHPEGLSNVLLEASATGRPCICTDRPGCREVVSDGVNGLYCKEKDPENLANCLERFCSMSEEQHREMGRKGRLHVEKNFDRALVVEAYRKLLK